jgi:hypothetical protein
LVRVGVGAEVCVGVGVGEGVDVSVGVAVVVKVGMGVRVAAEISFAPWRGAISANQIAKTPQVMSTAPSMMRRVFIRASGCVHIHAGWIFVRAAL